MNNSVGNDWDYYCVYKGETFTKSVLIDSSERGSTAEILVTIIEKDSVPDKKEISVNIPIEDGKSCSETIVITENKGRYKGNKAKWAVSISVTKQ